MIISNYHKAVIAYALMAFLLNTMFQTGCYSRMNVLKSMCKSLNLFSVLKGRGNTKLF